MLIYNSLLLVSVLLYLFEQKILIADKAKKIIACIFLLLPMMFISMFRAYSVGSDTAMYALSWAMPEISTTEISVLIEEGRWEIGFVLLCKFCLITPNPSRALLYISSFLIVGLTGISIFRISKNPCLSCLLYILTALFYSGMQTMRQSIAIAITMFAVTFLTKKHFFYYIMIIAIGACFHKSALLMLLLPIIQWLIIKFSHIFLIMFGLISLVIFTIPNSVFQLLLVMTGYENYQSTEFGASGSVASILFLCCNVMWLLYLGYGSDFSLKRLISNNENILFFSSLILGVFICIIAWKVSIVFRLQYYIFAICILFFSSNTALALRKNTNIAQYCLCMSTFVVLYLFSTYIVPDWLAVFPYSFMNFNNDLVFLS